MTVGDRAVSDPDAGAPRLDCTVEPWHGVFPGLGECWVAADGTTRVEPSPVEAGDPSGDAVVDTVEQRREALLHGWAEPLSWRRRGHDLAQASALVTPGATGAVLVLDHGQGLALTRLRHELAGRGWRVLSESPTPYVVEGDGLVLLPREAPLLGARRAPDERWDSRPARGDTDTVVVSWPRHTVPVRLVGLLELRTPHLRLPDIEPLVGRVKVPLVARLEGGGIWRWEPDPDPDRIRLDHVARLRFTALPAVGLAVGDQPDEVSVAADRLDAWSQEHLP